MRLIPTREEVLTLLAKTGGFRQGHFEYPDGLHSADYLQVALTMRSYDSAKILSVGLSRLVRANSEVRAMISDLSIVAPATGGLPVAYGVCEALRARQVYWAERDGPGKSLSLRQFLEVRPGEKVLLVDDILRSGSSLSKLKQLIEERGGEVVGVAVVIHQPLPGAASFAPLPFFALANIEATYYKGSGNCPLCARGIPAEKTWI